MSEPTRTVDISTSDIEERISLLDYQRRLMIMDLQSKDRNPIMIFGGNRISKSLMSLVIDEFNNFVTPIKDRSANLSPADKKTLKNFERLYQLAKIRRDRVQMSSLEKQIMSIKFGSVFK